MMNLTVVIPRFLILTCYYQCWPWLHSVLSSNPLSLFVMCWYHLVTVLYCSSMVGKRGQKKRNVENKIGLGLRWSKSFLQNCLVKRGPHSSDTKSRMDALTKLHITQHHKSYVYLIIKVILIILQATPYNGYLPQRYTVRENITELYRENSDSLYRYV